MRQKIRSPWWLLALGLGFASTAMFLFAYTHEQDSVSGPVLTKWCNGNLNTGAACANQLTWNLNPNASNVDGSSGTSVLQALQNSFNSWQTANLNGQPVVNLSITLGSTTASQTSPTVDCVNVIGFVDPNTSDFSTGTIAFTDIATSFGPQPNVYSCNGQNHTCPLPSCIVDADIEFNPQDKFSTASPTPSGSFDLQAIASHEIGHMLGMDHSGLASSIMFAFGDSGGVPQRALSTDDTLGIGAVYPSSSLSSATGAIAGTITLSGGSGLFAAHVLVTDTSSGIAVTDGLTNMDGTYSIITPPGTYNVVALPLAGVYDLTDYGGWACGYAENSPPCCDPSLNPQQCNGAALNPPTNYSGQFH